MNIDIRLTDDAGDEIRNAIRDPLVAYNAQKVGPSNYKSLAVVISDASDTILGGLSGGTAYGWLYIEFLFVPEPLRGQGLGTKLMTRAEAEVIARGCHSAALDTHEFQARDFYQRMGYECFGELDNYPAGFSRYFMRKALSLESDSRTEEL